MVTVFITVDTEAYPRTPRWRETGLSSEIDREVFGVTQNGEFGVRFMADRLNAHELKGVFFVEALFACAVGPQPLRSIVESLRERGQDVQLHLHPEWTQLADLGIIGGRKGYNLKEFSLEEQVELISQGLRNLKECGASNLRAFRAGNFGADLISLRALAIAGIPVDTSYNACWLDRDCGMGAAGVLLQPRMLEGVQEFPISYFEDRPGHRRPAQLCACSSSELENLLLHAWRSKWHSVMLLSHSFELVHNRRDHDKPLRASRIMVNRFERLCRFLAGNRDKFRTAHFSDPSDTDMPIATLPVEPLQSAMHHTVLRYGEQLASRFF